MSRQQINVRVPDDQQARWKAAADAAGLDLSTWIRETCNTAAGRTPNGQRGEDTISEAVGTPVCPHPRERRRSTGYATICMDCGERVR